MAFIVPGVLFAVPEAAGADDAFVVLSGSMVPFFHPGDVIFVDHVPADSLKVGDVVTFRASPGSPTLITHRVIEVIDAGGKIRYRTQGDANEDPDPFIVTQEMVVGKYDFQIPHWGKTMQLLRSKVGYFLFIFFPGTFIVMREFVKLYKELDAADKAKKAAAAAKEARGDSGPPPPSAGPETPQTVEGQP